MIADLVAPVLRHHAAVLLVVVAAPVEMVDLKRNAAVPLGQGIQYLDAGRDDLGSDTVPGNGCDLVFFHRTLPR